MKNFQKLVLGLMVAGMAIGFSAFSSANSKLVNDWYTPLGNYAPGSSQAINKANYNSNPISKPTCSGVGLVCAAQFPTGSSTPTAYVVRN